ncbi:MAG: hypothetical protein IAF38_17175, partial [Bacteroidia bacterium]|nr:hypothetical protein [Bacteroidia bacterium]
LDFTYPKYENGWKFTADSTGIISMNNKKYPYLYWDGPTNVPTDKINWQEGFVVSKENLINFFEEKLSAMGLNSKEIADYITFWCPIMNTNKKNYIHFVFNEEYNKFAKLTVTPKPDNLFRVYMIWSKADEKINSSLTEQKILSFKRTGFTVLEWGGAETKVTIP